MITDFETNSTTEFNFGNSMTPGEWTYIGLSVYKTKRRGEKYEIHFVTKTKAGIEYSEVLSDQDIGLNCIIPASMGDGVALKDYAWIGAKSENETAKFSGYLNMVLFFSSPRTAVEMLSNAFRSPIKRSISYEPELESALIITDDTSGIFTNHFYDHSKNSWSVEISADPTFPQLVSLPGDTISVCEFYNINLKCKSVDLFDTPELYFSQSLIAETINIQEDGTFSLQENDKIVVFQTYAYNDYHEFNMCTAYDTVEYKLSYNGTTGKFEQENLKDNPYDLEVQSNTGQFYFYRNDSTGNMMETFSLGSKSNVKLYPLVKPDYGRSLLGESIMVDFDMTLLKYTGFGVFKDEYDSYPYDEIIAFSEDCTDVQASDPKIYRQPDGTFEQLDTGLFLTAGRKEICYKSPIVEQEKYVYATYPCFINDTLKEDYFCEKGWHVVSTPRMISSISGSHSLYGIGDFISTSLKLDGNFFIGDQLQIFNGTVD